jgi:hypothetical protein
MATSPVRVPDAVREEAIAAARLLGCSPGDLLADAWKAYVATPDFRSSFEDAQKAIVGNDLSFIKRNLDEAARRRAAVRAARAASKRDD